MGSWLGVVLAVPPIGPIPTTLDGHLTAYDPGKQSGALGDLAAGPGAGAEKAYDHEEERESA